MIPNAELRRRSRVRMRLRELNAIVDSADILALRQMGAPADEYDCLADFVFQKLREACSVTDLAQAIVAETDEHFGLAASDADAAKLAADAVAWYEDCRDQFSLDF